MAEAFVRTFKRDYVRLNPTPDAASVLRQLPGWFEHYNTVHPHKALGYHSPREFRALAKQSPSDLALGAPRRALHRPPSAAGLGSSPSAAQSAETQCVWLDASTATDQP